MCVMKTHLCAAERIFLSMQQFSIIYFYTRYWHIYLLYLVQYYFVSYKRTGRRPQIYYLLFIKIYTKLKILCKHSACNFLEMFSCNSVKNRAKNQPIRIRLLGVSSASKKLKCYAHFRFISQKSINTSSGKKVSRQCNVVGLCEVSLSMTLLTWFRIIGILPVVFYYLIMYNISLLSSSSGFCCHDRFRYRITFRDS